MHWLGRKRKRKFHSPPRVQASAIARVAILQGKDEEELKPHPKQE
jgi:hypothetical protein